MHQPLAVPLGVSSPVRLVVHAPPASWGWLVTSGMASTGLINPFIMGGSLPPVTQPGYPVTPAAYISGLMPGSLPPTTSTDPGTSISSDLAAQVGAFQTIPYPGMMTAGIPWY